jgi:hypothetical protein
MVVHREIERGSTSRAILVPNSYVGIPNLLIPRDIP